MSADLLRRAAAKIRETAKGAHPGPWLHEPEAGDLEILGPKREVLVTAVRPALGWSPRGNNLYKGPNGREYTADHIAMWSPDVAELVAAWLEHSAFTWDASEAAKNPMKGDDLASWFHHETALARRILGEQP